MSFFGGGTDYPTWVKEHSGAVLSTTIDKFCYISARVLPPFFEYKYRIVYSKVEMVCELDEIQHPAVREVLRWSKLKAGLEIHHAGDLPARSGLGSSSSFTVGMINTLNALQGKISSKEDLAKTALHLEQNVMREAVGAQDQVAAAFGGFNKIVFNKDHTFDVTPIIIGKEKLERLNDHLMMFFTGVSRYSNEIAKTKIKNLDSRERELKTLYNMVDEAIDILNGDSVPIIEFGKLLHESWMNKRSISDRVSTSLVDDIYDVARCNGAAGGKLLGAGGGGFILFFVEPSCQQKVREALKNLIEVPFSFDTSGSRIVLYQPDGL